MSDDGYREYLLREWELFQAHRRGVAVAAEIRRHIGAIHRVLDIGCGAGQELLPYLDDAFCVGFDLAPEAPPLARRLLREVKGDARLALGRAPAEALPLGGGQIDLVICRLVLPYTHTPSALAEVARVLRPGGGFSVQIHSPLYYLRKIRGALADRDHRFLFYSVRVLRTGICFHLSGTHREIRGTLETFLTRARLRHMAARVRLELVTQVENGNPYAPHLLFRRR